MEIKEIRLDGHKITLITTYCVPRDEIWFVRDREYLGKIKGIRTANNDYK